LTIKDSASGPGLADETAAAAGAAGVAAETIGAATAQMKASKTELRTMIYSFNEVLWIVLWIVLWLFALPDKVPPHHNKPAQ
jgi:hypothetical protein